MNESKFQSMRSAQGRTGLHPKWCLDPGVFEFETKHIFEKNWTPIGHECQLGNPGSFFRTMIDGQRCVVTRDKKKQIRVFQNVCRHRGTQLCAEPKGQLNSAFACPYHGWKYDLEGNLISAPNMQSVDGFDAKDFGLIEFEVCIWQRFLFATAEGISELAVRKLDKLASKYELSKFEVLDSKSYDVQANWKLFFQNFNECYHCPSVHPQLTPYSDFKESENEFEIGTVLGGPMKIRETAQTISRDGKYCGDLPKKLPASELNKARYFTVFPNLFVSMFPDYVMVHRIRPVSFDRTLIECDFLFHPETIQSPGFEPDKVTSFWDLTNRQDWEMCERVQVGLSTPNFHPSPYSNMESLLVAFDDHYTSQMTELGFELDGD